MSGENQSGFYRLINEDSTSTMGFNVKAEKLSSTLRRVTRVALTTSRVIDVKKPSQQHQRRLHRKLDIKMREGFFAFVCLYKHVDIF